MAKSYVTYNGTGGSQNLSIPFPFLDQDHIQVLVDNVLTSFSWVNSTTVQATTTVGTGNVKVKRVTPSSPLVTFSNQSGLTAEDLNTATNQTRYVAEEIEDAVLDDVITNDSVATANLQDGSVTTPKIATSAVTTPKIADANVTTAKIADANVTTAKIANANVTTAKIADSNVTTAKIADANVTTAKIADANVTTAKIADANVTQAKLAYPQGYTGYILIQDQKSNGTAGGGSTATTWTKRNLNTELVDTGGHATLASDVITLLAGTYRVRAWSTFQGATGFNRIRLRNTSDGTTVALGGVVDLATSVAGIAFLSGRFTLAATKNLELQYYASVGVATDGLGAASTGCGEVEVYSEIEFIRE